MKNIKEQHKFQMVMKGKNMASLDMNAIIQQMADETSLRIMANLCKDEKTAESLISLLTPFIDRGIKLEIAIDILNDVVNRMGGEKHG